MRGVRRCGTCQWFDPLPDIYRRAGCMLAACACRAADKTFGIALCPNYIPQKFLDTSGSNVDGVVDGHCRWTPPPFLADVIDTRTRNSQRNSTTSWCSCWERLSEKSCIEGAGSVLQLSHIVEVPDA